MKAQIVGLKTASAIFGLMGLVQLVRLLVRPEVIVAGHLVPLWPSALALLVLAMLSVWLHRLSRFEILR